MWNSFRLNGWPSIFKNAMANTTVKIHREPLTMNDQSST